MADTYYQTASGFGVADNVANVPVGATTISLATYNGLVAAADATNSAAATAALNQRKADYTTVYAALRSMGLPANASLILAKSIGDTPAVDPELNVKAMTQQSTALTFNHSIAAAAGTFEKITEVPDLTIQETGLYKITWQAMGEVTIPGNQSGLTPSATTVAAAYRNGAIIAGTETRLDSFLLSASPAINLPAHGVYVTGSGETFLSLTAADTISLYAKKATNVASTHSVRSDTDGRTRISVERIRPA